MDALDVEDRYTGGIVIIVNPWLSNIIFIFKVYLNLYKEDNMLETCICSVFQLREEFVHKKILKFSTQGFLRITTQRFVTQHAAAVLSVCHVHLTNRALKFEPRQKEKNILHILHTSFQYMSMFMFHPFNNHLAPKSCCELTTHIIFVGRVLSATQEQYWVNCIVLPSVGMSNHTLILLVPVLLQYMVRGDGMGSLSLMTSFVPKRIRRSQNTHHHVCANCRSHVWSWYWEVVCFDLKAFEDPHLVPAILWEDHLSLLLFIGTYMITSLYYKYKDWTTPMDMSMYL